jgi:hypothetical protein
MGVLHRLRRAMVRPERELLSGVFELDQSLLGGRSHGKAGGATEKAPITIAVERLPVAVWAARGSIWPRCPTAWIS